MGIRDEALKASAEAKAAQEEKEREAHRIKGQKAAVQKKARIEEAKPWVMSALQAKELWDFDWKITDADGVHATVEEGKDRNKVTLTVYRNGRVTIHVRVANGFDGRAQYRDGDVRNLEQLGYMLAQAEQLNDYDMMNQL